MVRIWVVAEVVWLAAQLHIRPIIVGHVVALRIFFRRRKLRVDGTRWVSRRRRVHQKRGTHDHHTPLIIFEVNFDAQIIPLSSRFRLQFRLRPSRSEAPPLPVFCSTHVTRAGTNQRGERAGFESTSLTDSDELLAESFACKTTPTDRVVPLSQCLSYSPDARTYSQCISGDAMYEYEACWRHRPSKQPATTTTPVSHPPASTSSNRGIHCQKVSWIPPCKQTGFCRAGPNQPP